MSRTDVSDPDDWGSVWDGPFLAHVGVRCVECDVMIERGDLINATVTSDPYETPLCRHVSCLDGAS